MQSWRFRLGESDRGSKGWGIVRVALERDCCLSLGMEVVLLLCVEGEDDAKKNGQRNSFLGNKTALFLPG